MNIYLQRHCEENKATEGSFIRRSNPFVVITELKRIASSKLLRLASQFLLAMTFVSSVVAQSHESKTRVLNEIASVPIRNDFAMVAARIYRGEDTAAAYHQLDTLLSRAYGDMFWMYGCAGLYYAVGDRLRPEYKARIRECWKHCTPYRGDTENHFLMYYGSLFLMSQAWPDLVDTDWFMGKSSKEIYDESKEYLDHWIDETVRNGQEEWDSPRYGYYYITPLALLTEYTKDARMKHRFEMMLEYELASYAADYLNGSYCGAHSRVSDDCAIDPHSAEIETYGNYFFGEDGGVARLDTLAAMHPDIAFAAMTSFECPKIIRNIANDRDEPYEQFSLKRGRQMLRNLDLAFAHDISGIGITYDSDYHAYVEKYDYMTKDYCLGSILGGLIQPIQQQSWSLVFNSDKHHNIITGLEPYVSADELGMFFQEYPSFQLERISGTKSSYTSEDKWEGGSPYSGIFQYKNHLGAAYELSDDSTIKYRHADIFIPRDAHWLERIPIDLSKRPSHDTWEILMVDSVYVGVGITEHNAYDTLPTPGGTRIRITGESNFSDISYDIICSSVRETSLDGFEKSLQLEEHGTQNDPDWLFHSPFLESKKGSGILTMRCKGETRVLDFNK